MACQTGNADATVTADALRQQTQGGNVPEKEQLFHFLGRSGRGSAHSSQFSGSGAYNKAAYPGRLAAVLDKRCFTAAPAQCACGRRESSFHPSDELGGRSHRSCHLCSVRGSKGREASVGGRLSACRSLCTG